jgi:zinc protease
MRRLAAAAAVLAAAGCVPRRGRVDVVPRGDPSWAPLPSLSHLAAMQPTLVPDAEQQMQLPRFTVNQQVLPSGLRLGVETGETRGLVAVVTVVGTGSSADPPDHEGLAHLVEHLVYHAHGKSERTASDRLGRLGAQYNADTSVDATRYYEIAPASALTEVLAVAAERIARPLAGVDEDDFERERAIVENEINQRNEIGVYGRVVAWLQTAMFPPGHPYARPIGGSRASLQRLTLADARNFAAEHYRPANVSMLVTGEAAVAPAAASVAARLPASLTGKEATASRPPIKTLQPAASTAAAAPAPAAAPGPPPRPQARPDSFAAAIALPEIWIAYDLGGGGYDSAIAKILTSRAAEAAIRDRLMPEKEVLGVDFFAVGLPGKTVLACQIVLDDDRRRSELADKARDVIWRLWSEVGQPVMSWRGWQEHGAVLDLRQAALADAIFGAEPFVDRALERARAFQSTGAIEAYDRVLATIGAVNAHDLRARAFALLAPARARTLFLRALPEAQRPPPGLVGVPSSANLPMATTRLRLADLGPPPRVTAPAGLRDAKVLTLLNGLTVVLVPRPQFPSVTALLGFHGGAAAMPPGVLEMVRIVESELHKRHPNKTEILKVDGRGFTADFVRTDRRRLSNALYALANRLRLVADVDWQGLLSRAQSQITPDDLQAHDEPRSVAALKILGALYGQHPYGRRFRAADLMALNPALAPQWLPHLYNPRNGFLVIVGDIDVQVAAWLVSGWFGSWQGAPNAGRLTAPPVGAPATRPARETVQITHRPVASQVEVTFACRLPFPATGRERAAQRMLADILDGYLTTQIREQAGAAYSVDASASTLPAGGAHLTVGMSVDTRRLRDALRVLYAELDALAAGKIDKGAVSQARWSLAGEDALDYQTGIKTAGEILGAFALGVPLEALDGDADELARVTDKDIARAFAPCLSSRVLSLVGDEATIRASM